MQSQNQHARPFYLWHASVKHCLLDTQQVQLLVRLAGLEQANLKGVLLRSVLLVPNK